MFRKALNGKYQLTVIQESCALIIIFPDSRGSVAVIQIDEAVLGKWQNPEMK